MTMFPEKVKIQKQKILLFMDKATRLLSDITFCNVILYIFEFNKISIYHSLNHGILQALKVGYRNTLVKKFISETTESPPPTTLSKSLNIRDSVNWISMSVKGLNRNGIEKFFSKARFHVSLCFFYLLYFFVFLSLINDI